MRYQFRPLDAWAGPQTPASARRRSQFKAHYDDTVYLLLRETEMLGADHLVLQVDLSERDVRTDGMPRANARYGTNPGVVVSFDSKHGPLRYATDVFDRWRDNLRAIALALEALRAVDRYGVSKRGEQYRGWSALTAGQGASLFTTRAEAETWLRKGAAENGIDTWPHWEALYKALAKRMHPDAAGGSQDLWDRLDAAATLLGLRENKSA